MDVRCSFIRHNNSGRGRVPRASGMTSKNHVRARLFPAFTLGLALLSFTVTCPPVYAAGTTRSAPQKVPEKQTLPEPQQFVLQNGMHVVVLEDPRAPVVTHFLTFKSGAADDPAGLSGVAGFVARLMKTGTSNNPDGSYDAEITRDGGEAGAFTTHDYTVFYTRIAKDKLRDVMDLEADRMAHLTFGGDKVDRMTTEILATRHRTIDNDPEALALEQARAALYLTHPYGTPVIGWPGDIRHISRSDVVSFYKRHYAPNNAVLVVVGDVKPDAVLSMAEAEYGVLPRQRLVPRTSYTMTPRLGPTRISISRPGTRVTEFLRIYRVKSYANAAPGEAEALEIAAEMLGGNRNGFLQRNLIRGKALASKISVEYHGYASDAGELIIRAKPTPGVPLARLEQGIDTEIYAFVHHPGSARVLREAKAQLTAAMLFRRDDPQKEATAISRALAIGLTLQDVTDAPKRIDRVNGADVGQVAKDALDPSHSVTVYLTPGR